MNCPEHVLEAIERIKRKQSTLQDHVTLLQYRGSGQNCDELQKLQCRDTNYQDCYGEYVGELPPSLML